MAIYKKGADTVALRASAERIANYAHELEGIGVDCDRVVSSLKGQWGGGDLEQFVRGWGPARASITTCRGTFDQLARVIQRNAGQQDDTSGNGAGGAGSPFSRNPGAGSGDGNGGDHNKRNPTGGPGKYVPVGQVPMSDSDLEMVDIRQGQVGDCWVLAALGPVAQNDPQFIRDHVKYDAQAGTYTVTLYDDGEPVQVTVDASVVEQGAKDANGNANYASIYEKAIASFEGGTYDDIDGGKSSNAFEIITGRDADSGGESNFDSIEKGLREGRLYAVGSEDDPGTWFTPSIEDNRLVPNHAYMVDKVEMHDGQRMIHLVNPWGPGGGSYEGEQRVGDIWLTEDQYQDSFDSTYSVDGKKK